MMFQSNRHKQIFETERLNLRKLTKKALAADKALWQKTKTFLTSNGKIDSKGVHLGDVSTDIYAL